MDIEDRCTEGAARWLAGKRKREEELAYQPVRHSLWEQDSLEAYNEVLLVSVPCSQMTWP